MGIAILAHVGIPLLAGILVILIVAAAEKEPISWAKCNDIALDLTILSIGANGGIFVNQNIIKHWGENTPVYSILVVLVTLLLAGFLVYNRRWRNSPVTAAQGIWDLFLGCLAIVITVSVLYQGLQGVVK